MQLGEPWMCTCFAKMLLCFVADFNINLYSKLIFLFFLCIGNQPLKK